MEQLYTGLMFVILSTIFSIAEGSSTYLDATPTVIPGYCGIRLVDGSNQYEGRVEICIDGEWGTVCDDSWNSNDAEVVCRQLGYSLTDTTAIGNAQFGYGSGTIWLDDVHCSGSESTLLSCPHNGVGQHNCDHYEDAGVRCSGDQCLDIYESNSGCCVQGCNVGSCYCDSDCHEIGDCCSDIQALGCNPSNDSTTLDPSATPVSCSNGQVRLVDGSHQFEGRVEICINREWGSVCDNQWDNSDAKVVCRQLGYPESGAIAIVDSYFGHSTSSTLLNMVQCLGDESTLLSCQHSNVYSNNYYYYYYDYYYYYYSHYYCDDAGVRCSVTANCSYGDVRLSGGFNPFEGRVEICINREWGTVCDDGWDDNDAKVVCRQLGFITSNATAYSGSSYFGIGVGRIELYEVDCTGRESTLLGCHHFKLGDYHYCSHYEDAGVRCEGNATQCTYGELRLVGDSDNEGRVEICIDGEWGTVCDDSWDSDDAKVVCRQLGYSTNGAVARQGAYYDEGKGAIYLDEVECSGSESELLDCFHHSVGIHDCGHKEDAGVKCPVNTATITGGQIAGISAGILVIVIVIPTVFAIFAVFYCLRRKKFQGSNRMTSQLHAMNASNPQSSTWDHSQNVVAPVYYTKTPTGLYPRPPMYNDVVETPQSSEVIAEGDTDEVQIVN